MGDTKKLYKTISDINQRWDADVVTRGAVARNGARLSTGFAAVDALLDGGFPAGGLTALVGKPTSGATSLALSALAGTTGHAAALDPAARFDPVYATRLGVDLARLVIARPDNLLGALEIARHLVRAASLLLLDTPDPLPDEAVRRLLVDLRASDCVLLVIVPQADHVPVGASLVLHAERLLWLVDEEDVCGYRARVTVLRGRIVPAERAAEFEVYWGARGDTL